MFFALNRDKGNIDMAVLDFDLTRGMFEDIQILVRHLGEGLADGDVDDSDRAGRQSQRVLE